MPYRAHFGTIERRIEHHATKADDAEQSCQIKCTKQELERAKLLISYKYRLILTNLGSFESATITLDMAQK